MIMIGGMGETSITSNVPNSFSFVIDTDVIIAQINIRMRPITPGTVLYAPFRVGL